MHREKLKHMRMKQDETDMMQIENWEMDTSVKVSQVSQSVRDGHVEEDQAD